MKFAAPLGVFLVLAAFLAAGLRRDPREIPSPLVGKPAPGFVLAQLHEPDKTLASRDLLGQVWLLNVWASWCVTCREEHDLLTALARAAIVPIYGLNTKDERGQALAFLGSYGNPYVLSAQDTDGRTAIDYGVYGVPETYLIDTEGVIRFKQIGALTVDVIETRIIPLVDRLNR